MKKIFTISLISSLCCLTVGGMAGAATPWWQQSTICRINPTDCYVGMGTGFDNGMWDATSSCWGLKLICHNALTTVNPIPIPTGKSRIGGGDIILVPGSDPVPMGKIEIASGTGIKQDFDTGILNGDCFGSRKTTANGSLASVNGNYVNVWCSGILNSSDELLPNGEITFGAQPKCKDLSPNGWVAVLDKRCYGKFYDPTKYYIECEGVTELPKRLIVLNGAEAITGSGSAPSSDYPTDVATAQALFDKMQSVSAEQKAKYF